MNHDAEHTNDEPIEEIRLYQQTRSNDIATYLLERYESMVRMAAGKMARNRPDLYEDLYQVGRMSLLRLFEQFDPCHGVKFEAYAMKSMIGHLKNFLRDKSWYIQVPRRIKEKGHLIQKAIDELTVQLERSPDIPEIAAYLELSVEETVEVLAGRECYHYVSLDTPLSQHESAATIGDMMSTGTDQFSALERRLDLEQAIESLKEEEKRVLIFALNEGRSQRSIAQEMGISQMSVSRIQRRAVSKLKEILHDPDSKHNLHSKKGR